MDLMVPKGVVAPWLRIAALDFSMGLLIMVAEDLTLLNNLPGKVGKYWQPDFTEKHRQTEG